jgi:hypothetical protein
MALRPTGTAVLLLGACLCLAPTSPAHAKDPPAGTGTISGRVIYRGRGLPAGRAVRVEAGSHFPLLGGPAERSQAVDKKGGFTFEKLPAATYWVIAYIDDDQDGRRSPGEICAYPRLAPIRVGPDHPHVKLTIELDPVHAILATRFRVQDGTSRVELAFVALYVRHPATGAPLADAAAAVEVDGQVQPLTYDPAFPGGAFVLYGDHRLAGERYIFTAQHPLLGKAKRRIALHGRHLGSEPYFIEPTPTRAPAGQPLTVGWHQPSWANFATLEAFEPDPLGGARRSWPLGLGSAAAADSPATLPLALGAGRTLRLEVVVAKADVRAENGEIWSFAARDHEVRVGAPGSRLELLKVPPPARPAPPKPLPASTPTAVRAGAAAAAPATQGAARPPAKTAPGK